MGSEPCGAAAKRSPEGRVTTKSDSDSPGVVTVERGLAKCLIWPVVPGRELKSPFSSRPGSGYPLRTAPGDPMRRPAITLDFEERYASAMAQSP